MSLRFTQNACVSEELSFWSQAIDVEPDLDTSKLHVASFRQT